MGTGAVVQVLGNWIPPEIPAHHGPDAQLFPRLPLADGADAAQKRWDETYRNKEGDGIPEDIPEKVLSETKRLIDILRDNDMVRSGKEAKRKEVSMPFNNEKEWWRRITARLLTDDGRKYLDFSASTIRALVGERKNYVNRSY